MKYLIDNIITKNEQNYLEEKYMTNSEHTRNIPEQRSPRDTKSGLCQGTKQRIAGAIADVKFQYRHMIITSKFKHIS